MLRWFVRGLLGVIALVAILVAFLHTPWGKSFVRGRIEAKLAAAVDGSVHLGAVDYGFLFSHVELKDLEIRDRDGKPALAIGTLHVVANRRSLLRGAPVIDDLAIDGLAVTVAMRADGKSNLAGLFKPSGSPPPSSVHVAKLHVGGAATITRPDGTTFTISDLAIDGAASARPAARVVDASLAALTAKLAVAVPGQPVKQLDVALGPLAVKRDGSSVDAKLEHLAIGALTIGAVEAKLDIVAGKLSGPQTISIAHGALDHAKLQTLLGRDVIASDATFDASLVGPPDKLVAHGAVATGQANLTLDGTVDLSDPAKPRYDIALAGKGATIDVMAKPPAKLPPVATEIRIAVVGSGAVPPDLDANVTLDVGKTQIGKLAVDSVHAKAHARAGGVTLESLVARGLGFEITASGRAESDTTLDATIAVEGTPSETIKVLREAGIAVWHRVPPVPHVAVKLHAHGKLEGQLELEVEPSKMLIAGGSVAIAGHASLDHKKLRDAATTIDLHGLDLGALARLTGKPPPKLPGALSGHLALSRTPQKQRADYDLTIALPAVAVEVHGAADLVAADVRARVLRRSDRALLATATAHVAHDDQGLLPQGGWHVVIDAPRRSFAELAELAPNVKLPEGDVALHAELAGTPAQPRGTIDATIHATTPAGPQDAVIHATVAPGPRGLAVTANGTLGELATLAATVALPSPFVGRKVDPKRLRAGASFDATITVPERELAKLPLIEPKLAALGGVVAGEVKVRGTATAPELAATFTWHGFALTGGGSGATTIAVAGTPAHVTAEIGYGPEGTKPLSVTADVARGGGKLAVVAKIHGAKTSLAPLVPAGLLPQIHGADPGSLEADLTARIALLERPHGVALDDANLEGTLALRGGSFALPHGTRSWHGIELELAGDPQGIRLAKLAAHESDEQAKDRSLAVSGLVTIAKQRDASGALVMKPARGELEILLHDWLVLGSGSPLLSDAPVASVDLDAKVVADLAAPIIAIDATIAKLEFSSPDRLDRSHQPEKAQVAGDVIFDSPPGVLPVPPKPVASHPKVPLDIRVHIPEPIHALKAPLDLMARGELTVTVRETGVATRGTLEATGGDLLLFGRVHPISHGTLVFSDEHPHGEFSLAFTHPLPAEVVRELSRGDEPTRVSITGAPTKPVIALGGSFNSTLEEALSLYHAGHPVFLARPGLYPSSTAEVPRGDQFLVFGYISSALPHFLFLDRIAAWADPTEPRGAYGRIRNLEADRYAESRASRLRVVGRPTLPGRSTAELQLDHLWVDSARVLFGAGVRAGDRLGGGLGLFLEWSSAH